MFRWDRQWVVPYDHVRVEVAKSSSKHPAGMTPEIGDARPSDDIPNLGGKRVGGGEARSVGNGPVTNCR